MARVNLYDFGDILQHARSIGFDWNVAHEFLVNDGVPPMYEINSISYHKSDTEGNAFGWSEDTLKVMKSFFAAEGVTKFTLVNC